MYGFQNHDTSRRLTVESLMKPDFGQLILIR